MEVVSVLYLVTAVATLAHLWSQPVGLIRRARVHRTLWTVGLVLLPLITPVASFMLIPRRMRRVVKTGGWP
ncbi:MAG: hypothetical protein ABR592_07875 [Nitriliruptorales bacterium]